MIKTYSLNIVGNTGKIEFLNRVYNQSQEISDYLLKYIKESKEYRKSEIHKATYFPLREKYPEVNSKLIQLIRDKVLSSVKARKLFKTKKVLVPIMVDMNFNLRLEEKYFNGFLRFFRTNFPLEGKRILKKLEKVNNIKKIELIPKANGKYFKVFFVCEVEDTVSKTTNKMGLDVNLKNITLSDGKKFNLKPYIHKKINYKKHKDIKKIENWSMGYLRSLTNNISNYLLEDQVGYLVLEDLRHIRKNFSRKRGTSKGKNLNYLINNCFPYSEFSRYLEDSCNNKGILIEKINPRNTSKTCSICGSLDTKRPKQNKLTCNTCKSVQNADRNGAKNIYRFSSIDSAESGGRLTKLVKQDVRSPSALA